MSRAGTYRLPYETGELRLDLFRTQSPGWWSLGEVLTALGRPGPRRVVLLWLAASALSVITGIGVVALELSAIPIPLGFTTVVVTVYPPILLGMLLLLWLGPGWAMSATYLATFALGAYAGLEPGVNVFFSLADPVQLLVVWGGLMVLDVPFEIRGRGNWSFFLALVLTGSVASSLGALIWNNSQHLDFDQGLRIWQGWVVGAFVQGGLLVVPIHRLAGTRVRRWLEANLEIPCRQNLGPRGGAMLLGSSLLLILAIAVQVVRGFVTSLERARPNEDALAALLPQLGLFVGSILAAVLGAAALFTIALARRTELERNLARVDALTECLNRLAFAEVYAREGARSYRLNLPLSTVFMDLDHFKAINDDCGYTVGDRVLREMAARLKRMIRSTDYLFRWGGEEFIALLPHTSERDATLLAQRMCEKVRSAAFSHAGAELWVTASFGVAEADRDAESPREVVDRAARACRAAKRGGRDRVEVAAPSALPGPADQKKL